MPRPASLKRNDLLTRLAGVFRAYGYDGASMAALSAATGLSKASLYHHFPSGKHAMASAVLADEGKRLQQLVLAPLGGDSPAAGLTASLNGVADFYGGPAPQCLMNSIMLGEGGTLFGADIGAAVAAWTKGLSAAHAALSNDAAEAEAWARYALERIQGALILCRLRASRAPLENCLDELRGDVAAVAAA